MIQTVVWDIGMVLVEWHPEAFYDATIGPERRRALFDATDLHTMNEAIDLGTHSRDAAYAHAEKHPDWADEIRLWHDNWRDMLRPDIPASARLLRALKAKGIPCVSLTNFGWNTMHVAKKAYPILTEFDQEFISGELKCAKPDPAIYAHVEAGTGLSGEALLFTDDRPENCATAEARGWKTHVFEGPEGWAERLVTEGCLTEAEAAALVV